MRIFHKIFQILLIFGFAKYLEANTLDKDNNLLHENSHNRIKRGYSKYGQNDFGTSIQVSSGVLQYGAHEDHSSIGASSQYANNEDWQPSQLTPGYEVWLEPSQIYPDPSPPHDTSLTSTSSIHPGSNQISNGIFSTDTHLSHVEMSSHNPELHTQISGSSGISSGIGDGDIDIGHHQQPVISGIGVGDGHISDNIDFNNFADIKGKHYAKSYGK